MSLFSSKKRVLILGGEGVSLFSPTAQGVEREIALPWDDAEFDRQLVSALVRKDENDPVLVLFDGADQTYRKEENIPKMSRFDRPLVIQRKLDQAFPSYPIRASIEVKGSAGKNGQPSYLFVAIPETDRIDKVSACLLEAGVPVAGFGLLPAESEGLVTALSTKLFGKKGAGGSNWAVLIGQHETGGLRQVVVKNGNLALTRMTPVSEAGVQGAGWAEEVIREFKATLTYIARFGYTPEEGLDVIVICGVAEKHLFNRATFPVTNFQCMTVTEALIAIGSSGLGIEKNNFGDALHAAWSSRKKSMTAPIKVPSIHRIAVPRQSARMVSVVAMLVLLGLCGFSVNDYMDYSKFQASIEQKQRQKSVLDREHDEVSKAFDALPVRPDVVKAALTAKALLDDNSMNITPILNGLHKALPSDVRFSQLTIEHNPSKALKIPGTGNAPSVTGKDGKQGIVMIDFKITMPWTVPLEDKVRRADALVKTLKETFPGYDVKLVSQFGNVSGGGKFAGGGAAPVGGGNANQDAEITMEGAPL